MQNNCEKWQKVLCFLPFISTVIVLIITYVKLSKNKADFKKWLYFVLIMAGAMLLVAILNQHVLSGQFLFLNWIASALVFTGANLELIDLQKKCTKNEVTEKEEKKLLFSYQKAGVRNAVIVGIAIFVLLCFLLLPVLMRALCFQSKYEDLNGEEDFSLCLITKEDVLLGNDYEMRRSSSTFDGSQTNVEGRDKDRDWEECYWQATIFDGVCLAQATNTNQDEMTLSLRSTVTQGNFEIFIVINGVIQYEVAANCEEEIHLDGIQNKMILVMIAGEAANFSFEVSRTAE